MKPTTTIILIIVATLVIGYFIHRAFKVAPGFDINAYNKLGQQGIVKRFGDYPYCETCTGNSAYNTVSNGINYPASTVVNDPTAIARQRALTVLN